jgi:hypothetical protein
MGLSVFYAGQNITNQVQESTIDIQLNLAQGAGASQGGGQSSQLTFLAKLNSVGTSVGAGTTILTPQLVRLGEVVIKDSKNQTVFGGFAVQLDDQTIKKNTYTKITACDYWQSLQFIGLQNELYQGKSDVYIIKDLLHRYASWIDLSHIPSKGGYTFNILAFSSKTLLDAIQQIADTAGWMIWITPDKQAYYTTPLQASTAPFALADDGSGTYCAVDQHTIDDTQAINRIFFYGGKQPTKDFKQDLSVQANGENTKFLLAYFPKIAADGKIHVGKNGSDLVLGIETGSSNDANNILKKDGGNADVLLNPDAKTLTFSVAPSAASKPYALYRYELPLSLIITDEESHRYFGQYLDGFISDSNVIDTATGVQRCKIALAQYSMGVKTLSTRIWKPGIQPGQIVRVDHSVRGIHDSFVVQSVEITPLGMGNFVYTLTLGAWNWNLVDLLLKLVKAVTPDDTSTLADSVPIQIAPVSESASVDFNFSLTTSASGHAIAGVARAGFCVAG